MKLNRKQGWSDVIEEHQRSVDTSDGVVADAGLDGGHPGVDEVGHGGLKRFRIPPRTRNKTDEVGWVKRLGAERDGRGGWPSCLDAGAWAVTLHVMEHS